MGHGVAQRATALLFESCFITFGGAGLYQGLYLYRTNSSETNARHSDAVDASGP